MTRVAQAQKNGVGQIIGIITLEKLRQDIVLSHNQEKLLREGFLSRLNHLFSGAKGGFECLSKRWSSSKFV